MTKCPTCGTTIYTYGRPGSCETVVAEHVVGGMECDLIRLEGDNARQARELEQAQAAAGWRCYHCGVWFTDKNAAEAHFGHDDEDEAACEITKRNAKLEQAQTACGAMRAAMVEAIEHCETCRGLDAHDVRRCARCLTLIQLLHDSSGQLILDRLKAAEYDATDLRRQLQKKHDLLLESRGLMDEAMKRHKAAEAVVAKQPKTRDGVPAYHGMKVWFARKPTYGQLPEDGTVSFIVDIEMGRDAIKNAYSTPAAALAGLAAMRREQER